MTDLEKAARLALEALDCIYSPLHVREINKVGAAMSALREALAEQPAPVPEAHKQEPVGYFSVNDYGRWEENEGTYGQPLYDRPQAREAGLLTEGEAWVSPYQEAMEHFAALAVAAEREACAAVCCDMIDAEYKTGKVDHNEMAWTQACANAIRARGEK